MNNNSRIDIEGAMRPTLKERYIPAEMAVAIKASSHFIIYAYIIVRRV